MGTLANQARINDMETNTPPSVTFVLGGARSGKSRFAESLAERYATGSEDDRGGAQRLVYLATGEAFDDEMRTRIDAHQTRRGEHWRTIEAPLGIADALETHCRPGCVVLLDCVSVWLGNQFHHEANIEQEVRTLVARCRKLDGTLVAVGSEVGLGIVPENALARAFRDAAGLLNQQLADAAQRVYLISAGIPICIKGGPEPSLSGR